jgi:hypothetical protein
MLIQLNNAHGHLFIQHAFFKRDDNDVSPYSWNITGTYKGNSLSFPLSFPGNSYTPVYLTYRLMRLSACLSVANFVLPLVHCMCYIRMSSVLKVLDVLLSILCTQLAVGKHMIETLDECVLNF